jgi:hypothetical protein
VNAILIANTEKAKVAFTNKIPPPPAKIAPSVINKQEGDTHHSHHKEPLTPEGSVHTCSLETLSHAPFNK